MKKVQSLIYLIGLYTFGYEFLIYVDIFCNVIFRRITQDEYSISIFSAFGFGDYFVDQFKCIFACLQVIWLQFFLLECRGTEAWQADIFSGMQFQHPYQGHFQAFPGHLICPEENWLIHFPSCVHKERVAQAGKPAREQEKKPERSMDK